MTLQHRAKMGRGPNPAPRWVGEIIARVLQAVGPTGLEFGRYSIGAQIAKPSSPYFMLHRKTAALCYPHTPLEAESQAAHLAAVSVRLIT